MDDKIKLFFLYKLVLIIWHIVLFTISALDYIIVL
jgi:hypothetical protein